jgi:hypothetical protein
MVAAVLSPPGTSPAFASTSAITYRTSDFSEGSVIVAAARSACSSVRAAPAASPGLRLNFGYSPQDMGFPGRLGDGGGRSQRLLARHCSASRVAGPRLNLCDLPQGMGARGRDDGGCAQCTGYVAGPRLNHRDSKPGFGPLGSVGRGGCGVQRSGDVARLRLSHGDAEPGRGPLGSVRYVAAVFSAPGMSPIFA